MEQMTLGLTFDTVVTLEPLDCQWVTVSRQGVEWQQSLAGQLTKLRTSAGTVVFVREGLDGSQSFHMSSNQRWGEKHGQIAKRRQVLHLAAPEAEWDVIAAAVARADHLNRPVLRNRRFSLAAAWDEWSRLETRLAGTENQLVEH